MRNAVTCLTLGLLVAIVTNFPARSNVADAAPATQPQAAEALIVFSSNRGGAWAIWTVKPDRTQLRQLTKPATGEQDVDPAFNSDGSRILFTSTRGGKAGLWQMARDGSEPKRICDGDQGGWSPDGRRIVVRRGGKLITRELASEKEKTISPDDWDKCSGPAWSPDGASIAFAKLGGENSNAIYIVPSDGGTPTKVYDKQGACQPHWAPNGKTLVYETETHVCTINPDGMKNRVITYYGGVQRYARYSPDGAKLVFCQAASPEGPWELYTVPAIGGTPVKLTDGGSDMYPDWK
jgi:Tol biopolymer transport system component